MSDLNPLQAPTFQSDDPPAPGPLRPFLCGACSQHFPGEQVTRLRTGRYRCLPCLEDLYGLCQWPDRMATWRPLAAITMQPSIPSTIGIPQAQPFARSLRLRERAGLPLPVDGKARALKEEAHEIQDGS